MSKKLLATAVVLTALTLAACGGGGSKKAATTTTLAPTTTVPATTTTAGSAQKLTITPSTGLRDGQTVSITGTGYKPNEQLGVAECADKGDQTGANDCDLGNIKVTNADASGKVNGFQYTVHKGPFGGNHIVCGQPTPCLVSLAEAGVASPHEVATMQLAFA